ncbi:uncharacterized protein EV422DRAFT_564457 [Fimicolochytrium jonesii]|uniref:uncharacterized protein n=1 Tax=Fimicolochytrium jonesii TaxID=1396493 RepID=UPI0022FE08EF|nr:uncharacterized protein EV422DRAFT_564457 [Fimicolochytrium jonesii]KAI8825111.1 hypothetical protein EV422DRAFT_564457 [Fimicolochytrium jonesii]
MAENRMKGAVIETSWMAKAEAVAYSLLFSMVTDNEVHNGLATAITFFEDMQLISFAFEHHFFSHMPDWAKYVTNPLSYRPGAHEAFEILLAIVIGIVAVTILSAAQVARSFGNGEFTGVSLYALKTIRIVTVLSGTVLFIPFLEILLVAVSCSKGTLKAYPEVQCFSGSTGAQTVLAIFCLLFFVPYNLVMSLIYVRITPKPGSEDARVPIGRVDFTYALARVLLCHIFIVPEGKDDVKAIVLVPVTLFMTFQVVRFQPFYSSMHNELRAGLFCAAFFASIISFISTVGNVDSLAMPVLSIIAVVAGAVAGVFTCRKVFENTVNRVYDRIKLKRQQTEKGLNGKLEKMESGVNPEIRKTGALSGGSEDLKDREETFEEGIFDNIGKIAKTQTVPEPIAVFRHVGEVELACRFVRKNRSKEALYVMEEIFNEGFDQFPENSMLRLVYAEYLEAFTDSSVGEDAVHIIAEAKILHPSFDARFFIFMQDRLLEQSKKAEGLNSSTMNISSFVEFQTMSNGARRDHLATLIEIKNFLSHVRSGQRGRDPKTYPIFLQRISEAEQRATAYYKKLIGRWPKSKELLRMYASFLLQVKNDKDSAARLMAIADDIEEIESRQGTSYLMATRNSARSGRRGSNVPSNMPSQMASQMTSVSNVAGRLGQGNTELPTSKEVTRKLSTVFGESVAADASDDEVAVIGLPSKLRSMFPESVHEGSESQQIRKRSTAFTTEEGIAPDREVIGARFGSPGYDNDAAPRVAQSDGGSSKASEREMKKRITNRGQLQSRLKAPVNSMDRHQRIAAVLYVMIVVVAYAIGHWSFSDAESSIGGFVRGSRLPHISTVLARHTRELARIPDLAANNVTEAHAVYDQTTFVFKDYIKNISLFYIPYLEAYVDDEDNIPIREATFPEVWRHVVMTNSLGMTKLIFIYGQELMKNDYNWFASGQAATDNYARFFLDNAGDFGPAYMTIIEAMENKWTSATMQNTYILYVLLALCVVCMLGWGILVLWPMVRRTEAEQIRTLKMYLLIPKKTLINILTDFEEQIETISDEISDEGMQASGSEPGLEKRKGSQQYSSRAMATTDTDKLTKKSATRKYYLMYGLGLGIMTLPALALLIVPIIRASLSIKYAHTMNYNGGRRYFAQATLFYANEALKVDNATWLPYEPLMWYRNRVELLENLHWRSIRGIGCIALPTIPELHTFLSIDAPCQPACGNKTAGLDTQVELFLNAAQNLEGHLRSGQIEEGMDHLDYMRELMPSLVDNFNNLDKKFQTIILDGNAEGKLGMNIIFAFSLIGLVAVYFTIFQKTVKVRLVEMDSAVTLVFAMPDSVVQAVPEIKRFIDSGGMFADDGAASRLK